MTEQEWEELGNRDCPNCGASCMYLQYTGESITTYPPRKGRIWKCFECQHTKAASSESYPGTLLEYLDEQKG